MWPFKTNKIKAAVVEATADQMEHETKHPEPYDADQRRASIAIRARWKLKQAGVTPPSDLEKHV